MSTSRRQHRLLADECVYSITVAFLRDLGYDVATVREIGLISAKDSRVIGRAVALERVLLTRDMDFSNIVNYPPSHHLGVVVLKMTPQTAPDVHGVLCEALAAVDDLGKTLLIVDRSKYRLRR